VTEFTEVEKGHGRIEERKIEISTLLNEYLDWPEVGQVFRITRRRTINGKESVETVCGITSLTPKEADAKRLMELVRGHWGIENRLHWVRDVTMREDECRIRHRGIAQLCATFRNTVIKLIRNSGFDSIIAALEYFAEHRNKAINCIREENSMTLPFSRAI
jgi:predicted transposase YbfD/YdcC